MKKGLLTSLFVVALPSILTTVTFAQVDYSDPKQRNPQNDPNVERVFQQHQSSHGEKQNNEQVPYEEQKDRIETDKGRNTGKSQGSFDVERVDHTLSGSSTEE